MNILNKMNNYIKNAFKISALLKDTVNKHTKIILLFLAVIYKIFLDLDYQLVKNIHYYNAYSPSNIKYIESIILFIILFTIIPKNETSFVSIFLNLQFLIIISPILTVYAFTNGSRIYMYSVILAIIIQILILKKSNTISSTMKGIYFNKLEASTIIISLLIIFFCITISLVYNGFAGIKAFDFKYIYTMREKATFPPLFGYISSWTTKAIIPFLTVYTLHTKRYKLTIGLLSIDLMLFMSSGEKFILFIIPAVILIYFLVNLEVVIKSFYLFLSSGFILAWIFSVINRTDKLYSLFLGLFVDRLIFVPANIKFQFYDCFKLSPKIYFSDGILGNILSLTYPYDKASGFIINYFMLGNFNSNSNAGYLGESYSQIGIAGIFLTSILLAYIVRFINNNSKNLSCAVVTASCFSFIITLNDGAFQTTVFSGCLFLILLYLTIFNRPNNGDLGGEIN